jgi:mono/diheme cytochrome c family protein
MNPKAEALALVAYLAAVTLAAPASAEPNLERGENSFVLNCAVCHGMDGRGKGPLADALKAAPADLTQIAAKHGGEFPAAKISDVIRNGGAVLGHGTAEMPAWGMYFGSKGNPDTARSRIADLVLYLESIQVKASPAPPQ